MELSSLVKDDINNGIKEEERKPSFEDEELFREYLYVFEEETIKEMLAGSRYEKQRESLQGDLDEVFYRYIKKFLEMPGYCGFIHAKQGKSTHIIGEHMAYYMRLLLKENNAHNERFALSSYLQGFLLAFPEEERPGAYHSLMGAVLNYGREYLKEPKVTEVLNSIRSQLTLPR